MNVFKYMVLLTSEQAFQMGMEAFSTVLNSSLAENYSSGAKEYQLFTRVILSCSTSTDPKGQFEVCPSWLQEVKTI